MHWYIPVKILVGTKGMRRAPTFIVGVPVYNVLWCKIDNNMVKNT